MLTPVGPGLTDEQRASLDRAFPRPGRPACRASRGWSPGSAPRRPARPTSRSPSRSTRDGPVPPFVRSCWPCGCADRRGRPGGPRRRHDAVDRLGRRGRRLRAELSGLSAGAGRGLGRGPGRRPGLARLDAAPSDDADATGWPAGCAASATCPCWNGWSVADAAPQLADGPGRRPAEVSCAPCSRRGAPGSGRSPTR